jgi:hypothetical protein
MIAVTETTIGETVAEGIVWRVQRTPAGNWRICYREDVKRGVTYTWHEDWFRRFHGEPKAAEDVDAECERLLQRCSIAVQAAMRDG